MSAGIADDARSEEAVLQADILVVDDSEPNLIAIEAALGPLGSRVVRAQSGAEALRLLLQHDFALVFLDVNMPSMGGFETARIIRSRKRSHHTPIIFVTAYDHDDSAVQAAYELGAVDFLFKPIVSQVLLAKASVFVELHRRAAELARQAELIRQHERRDHQRTLADERHRWEEHSLRREMQQLAEADRRKDHFLAMLAHELRTPLTPIVTGLELMREKLPDDPRSDDVLLRVRAAMERQALHLKRLVDDLLDMSRISSGKLELQRRSLDAREIVTQAVAASRPLIDERRHQVEVELPETPLMLQGDEVRLVQVISNLLNNAARYTDPGGRIAVSACRVEDWIELRVRDNGRGMAAELLPNVFQMFVQAAPGAGGGLGVGLSLVARLVELHGGGVAAHSAGPGKGSELVVTLPTGDAVARAPSRKRQLTPTPYRRLRIVVIEDHDDIREMLQELLRMWQHEVYVAADGEGGAALVIERCPDVALVDVALPKLDGYGVARSVREEPSCRHVRLIAITGFGQDADRKRALAAGFDVHLVKPVKIDELKAVLSEEPDRDANRDRQAEVAASTEEERSERLAQRAR